MSVRSPRILQLFILWTDSHIVLIAHVGPEQFIIHVWIRTNYIDVMVERRFWLFFFPFYVRHIIMNIWRISGLRILAQSVAND